MSTVDREALIEAAAKARYERSTGHIWAGAPEQTRDCYRTECGNWLDAALPLIADTIEAERPHIPVSTDPKRRESIIVRSTLNRAARLVRSLLGTDGDR